MTAAAQGAHPPPASSTGPAFVTKDNVDSVAEFAKKGTR